MKGFQQRGWIIELIDEVIMPYVQSERKKLTQSNQEALLIMNLFRGQMTNAVFEKPKKNNIDVFQTVHEV